MNEKKFTISEAVSYGWQTTKKNFWFFLPITLVYLVINEWSLVAALFTKDKAILDFINLLNLFLMPLAIITSIGYIVVCLNKLDGKQASMKDLFIHWNVFLNFILAGVLYFLLIMALPAIFYIPMFAITSLKLSGVFAIIAGLLGFIGIILMIYPGIIWAIKYQYVFYLTIENYKIKDAFAKSKEMTKDIKSNLFFFDLILFLIIFGGILLVGIGLLVAYPVMTLAYAYVYRKLLNTSQTKSF